jgi:hypothetical protein
VTGLDGLKTGPIRADHFSEGIAMRIVIAQLSHETNTCSPFSILAALFMDDLRFFPCSTI